MKIKAYLVFLFSLSLFLGISCSTPQSSPLPLPPPESMPNPTPTPASKPKLPPGSFILPTEEGQWIGYSSHVGRKPTDKGTIDIDGIGRFTFDANQVQSLRPDIFQPGHFSLFDILVHLAERGDFQLEYHFDESMNTHVIDSINGESNWWYEAHYSAGWFENNVFRMDMYPYKNHMAIQLQRTANEFIERIYRTFQDEVARLKLNGGRVVIPEVAIRSPSFTKTFQNVVVTPYNTRTDALLPDVVTALDILISLGEQGKLSRLKLTWYDRIANADPVDSYWLEQIDDAEAFNGCGFVYETGPLEFPGFSGSHIHIPLDVRVIVSPEYALWFWVCL